MFRWQERGSCLLDQYTDRGRFRMAVERKVIAVVPARQCGTCTACCDGWVAGDIQGHIMKPGTACYFRGDGCCTIYERRPQHPCRDFICGWLQPDSPFPDEFKPDRLG